MKKCQRVQTTESVALKKKKISDNNNKKISLSMSVGERLNHMPGCHVTEQQMPTKLPSHVHFICQCQTNKKKKKIYCLIIDDHPKNVFGLWALSLLEIAAKEFKIFGYHLSSNSLREWILEFFFNDKKKKIFFVIVRAHVQIVYLILWLEYDYLSYTIKLYCKILEIFVAMPNVRI